MSQTTNCRITKQQLADRIGVHRNTASKEYAHIIDVLQLNRDYLTEADLIKYGV